MGAVSLTPADLAPFTDTEIPTDRANQLIIDAVARAAVIAPCILDDDFAHEAAAKAIIREAILRRNEAGTGAHSSVQTGPFGATVDTRQPRKGMFLQSEIDELKTLCGAGNGGAFSVDTVSTGQVVHTASCDLYFGGPDCSCGAILTQGLPLWGGGPDW